MSVSSGTRLGPYEVVAPLGAGGMGEVYRARDTRLGRDVAIKVLPRHLSSSPEGRARFEREARTVSSLNHPHICTLHDVGREGDTDYLVMELVEGETLAARLARGPLPAPEVLKLGAQIAEALERAHRAGVVHRDLKPGNVMLTRTGAKLMDFGLARAAGPASGAGVGSAAALTQSPTMATPLSAPLTAQGTIVGTFQYMAPEQLEGHEADARSDIWALGCVLYEMTTGKRAFEGATQASLISSIMRDQPRAMNELAPLSPPGLDRLVRQCLAKDPDERWQSAGDVRRELEWIASGSSAAAMPAITGGGRRRRVPWALIGPVAGAAIAITALVFAFGARGPRDSGGLARFMIASPAGTVFDVPAETELSPDGRTMVFAAADSGGTSRLYLRTLENPEPRVVPGTEHASLPFWSPDGRQIGFFANGKLRKIGMDGSPPADLCDAADARGGAWSKNGVIVFAPNNLGPLMRVSAGGGAPSAVTTLDSTRHERGHRYPQFLPDGRHFLYGAIGIDNDVSTYVADLGGGKPREVCRERSMGRYAAPGYLLFLDGDVIAPHRRLLTLRFDPGSLRTTGDAQVVLNEVNATNFGYPNVTTSAQGTLVVQHWTPSRTRIVWRDPHGAVTGVAVPDLGTLGASISPDGSRLAYSGFDPADLFVLDLSTGISTRLTFENQAVGSLVWSWDGRRIAFARLSGRGWETHVKSADGTGADSLLFHGPGLFSYPMSWSRDGRWLVAQCSEPDGNFDLWRVPIGTGAKPECYQHTPEQERGASLSPDGHWLLYVSDQGGGRSVFVQSFPDPGTKYQITVDDAAGASWTGDGTAILVITQRQEVVRIPITTAGGFRQGATQHMFTLPMTDYLLDIVPGERRFLTGSVLDQSTSTRLEIVFDWTRLLGTR
jgi:eukaryotic-like serine/threonine-protein kinase